MKKLLLVGFFFVLATGMVFSANNGSLTITGSVTSSTDVLVTNSTGYDNLDLSTTQADKKIGSAKFTTNRNSWVIGVYSTNGSLLKNGVISSLGYTFSLGTLNGLTTLTLGTSAAPTTKTMTGKTGSTGDSYDMLISYTGNAFLNEGTYTDTIFITIANS